MVTLARKMPIPSHNDTHGRIARLAAAIPSHPMGLSNRAAPSLLETRNQLSAYFINARQVFASPGWRPYLTRQPSHSEFERGQKCMSA
ncbi:hypothetical protein [Paraburkholderia sp. BL10I2N1]|uniref:hypothetical protein n=1 Tax=Paraburkholderia sp. BL10I2N1 TaxID=1938796 RepID=UPI001414F480|nr:hypothetical protein [Paraburkholderia sp. BL10I2N1]